MCSHEYEGTFMPYPLILATNGEMFARLNPDRSWSVRWDRTLDVAYTKPKDNQIAVWAFAKLLVAAKDNFFATPWDVSDTLGNEWRHYECIIDYHDCAMPPRMLQSTITYGDDLIARVNHDGSWSVRWDGVRDVLLREGDFDFRGTALVGICRMLKAAKDRFLTTPWDQPEDDD